jgi:hypothetical protein
MGTSKQKWMKCECAPKNNKCILTRRSARFIIKLSKLGVQKKRIILYRQYDATLEIFEVRSANLETNCYS